jgi:thiol:disulfide interchange protein DsbD
MNRFLLPLLWLVPLLAGAIDEDELLPPDQAFPATVAASDPQRLVARWDIAEGYYLYQHRLAVKSQTPGVELGDPVLPPGKEKEDEFFGRVVTYRDRVEVEIPILNRPPGAMSLDLALESQGCADLGVCYPPQSQPASLDLPMLAQADPQPLEPALPASQRLQNLLGGGTPSLGIAGDELLPPDEAFFPTAESTDGRSIDVKWRIADGYYLYRDKIGLELTEADGVEITSVETPEGEEKEDEFFGRIQVYYGAAEAVARLDRSRLDPSEAMLRVKYQGCADLGVCYPPMEKSIPVLLSGITAAEAAEVVGAPQAPSAGTTDPGPPMVAEQDRLAQSLAQGGLLTVATFFGLGLLLAFTPCIFPMIPILSGIIVGQGEGITVRQALLLSLIYVVSMALTYTAAGVLAGLFGQNLQVLFQQTWILIVFAAVFVLLSLSMFGFYELQFPASWQSRLSELSNRQEGGTYLGVAIMGFLSALIVGPCVAPPLAGALIYIGQTGDAVLGGTALFALSMGMGAPLLVIGASAGKLLPRAGAWMDAVKAVFGVGLLAVAIVLLERVLPVAVSMVLWGLLMIGSAVYMGAFESAAPGWPRLWRGLGLALAAYGVLMLIGAAAGGRDTVQPLRGVLGGGPGAMHQELAFKRIKSNGDLDREIAAAGAAGRPVMLDFYADWCVSCKEMEKYTFSDPDVIQTLSRAVLLQADVTANDEDDQALLQRFDLIGPPSILFFGADGVERTAYRTVGFMRAAPFQAHVEAAIR